MESISVDKPTHTFNLKPLSIDDVWWVRYPNANSLVEAKIGGLSVLTVTLCEPGRFLFTSTRGSSTYKKKEIEFVEYIRREKL